jgi:hypothetical protein
MKAIFSLLLMLLTGWCLAAPKPVTLPPDHSPVVARQADPALWERLRTDRAYQYGHEVREEQGLLAQLWLRFLRWLAEWLYDPSRKTTRDWLTGLLVVAVAVFGVWKILGMNSAALLGRRNAGLNVPYGLHAENIHAINFEREISDALAAGQFRLAVRLHYLQTLKRLTDAGLIDWQPDKTNHAYALELRSSPLNSEFEGLTTQFERVWYGDFPLESGQFEGLRRQFVAFDQLISARR